MKNELARVDTRGRGIACVSNDRRVMTEALRLMRSADGTQSGAGSFNTAPVILPKNGTPIDIPRQCAVHGRYYVARYIQDGPGSFQFGRTIRMEGQVPEQYEDASRGVREMPNQFLHEESCPWCGAGGFGAVLCGKCHKTICFGKTDANRYFRCTNACGEEGFLKEFDTLFQRGVHPSLRRDNPWFLLGS